MVFKLEAANASEFLLWVKWVLTNAKTVLSFVITLKSAKKSEEWERHKEKNTVGILTSVLLNQGQPQIYKVG